MFLFKGQMCQAVRESTSVFESDRKSGRVRESISGKESCENELCKLDKFQILLFVFP